MVHVCLKTHTLQSNHRYKAPLDPRTPRHATATSYRSLRGKCVNPISSQGLEGPKLWTSREAGWMFDCPQCRYCFGELSMMYSSIPLQHHWQNRRALQLTLKRTKSAFMSELHRQHGTASRPTHPRPPYWTDDELIIVQRYLQRRGIEYGVFIHPSSTSLTK
jgi:hypothetical protein